MTNLPLISAVLMAVMFVAGESLICDTCRVGIAGKCLFGTAKKCNDIQENCYWGKLAFNVSGLMSLHTRGCLVASLCNQTETGALLYAGYTVTRRCCSTDYCNGAPSLQLPLTAALGVAMTAIWSPWAF